MPKSSPRVEASLKRRILKAAEQEIQCLDHVIGLRAKRKYLVEQQQQALVDVDHQLEKLDTREALYQRKARELRNKRYRLTQLLKLGSDDYQERELPPFPKQLVF